MKNIPVGTKVKFEVKNRSTIESNLFTGVWTIEGITAWGSYIVVSTEALMITVHPDYVEPEDPKVRDKILWEEASLKMTEWEKCKDPVYFYENYWKPKHG